MPIEIKEVADFSVDGISRHIGQIRSQPIGVRHAIGVKIGKNPYV
jgi:hypothetical protein